jgi:hypothetical protein
MTFEASADNETALCRRYATICSCVFIGVAARRFANAHKRFLWRRRGTGAGPSAHRRCACASPLRIRRRVPGTLDASDRGVSADARRLPDHRPRGFNPARWGGVEVIVDHRKMIASPNRLGCGPCELASRSSPDIPRRVAEPPSTAGEAMAGTGEPTACDPNQFGNSASGSGCTALSGFLDNPVGSRFGQRVG